MIRKQTSVLCIIIAIMFIAIGCSGNKPAGKDALNYYFSELESPDEGKVREVKQSNSTAFELFRRYGPASIYSKYEHIGDWDRDWYASYQGNQGCLILHFTTSAYLLIPKVSLEKAKEKGECSCPDQNTMKWMRELRYGYDQCCPPVKVLIMVREEASGTTIIPSSLSSGLPDGSDPKEYALEQVKCFMNYGTDCKYYIIGPDVLTYSFTSEMNLLPWEAKGWEESCPISKDEINQINREPLMSK